MKALIQALKDRMKEKKQVHYWERKDVSEVMSARPDKQLDVTGKARQEVTMSPGVLSRSSIGNGKNLSRRQ